MKSSKDEGNDNALIEINFKGRNSSNSTEDTLSSAQKKQAEAELRLELKLETVKTTDKNILDNKNTVK